MYWLVGALIGFGVGYLTRPTLPLIGIPIPLELLASTAPLDLPFRNQLGLHLLIATALGAFSLGVLGHMLRGRKAEP